jgi:hypothetical protein
MKASIKRRPADWAAAAIVSACRALQANGFSHITIDQDIFNKNPAHAAIATPSSSTALEDEYQHLAFGGSIS